MTTKPPLDAGPWSILRRFARPRPPVERCDLCGAELESLHPHLFEPSSRQLQCACPACALLFSSRHDARFRRVDPRVELLTGFRLSDAQWDDLRLPINLAFFVRSTAGAVQAFYPSPAGTIESLLPLEAWDAMAAENPVLHELDNDVEALLVNRLGAVRDCYRVSIDECFKLAGLIRSHWRGLSGGTAVWEEIGRFFESLTARAQAGRDARCPT
jgi:hypothetical protein